MLFIAHCATCITIHLKATTWCVDLPDSNARVRACSESRALAAHKAFQSDLGDHVTLLNVWRGYCAANPTKRREWCRKHFVNSRAMSTADSIYKQLQVRGLGPLLRGSAIVEAASTRTTKAPPIGKSTQTACRATSRR